MLPSQSPDRKRLFVGKLPSCAVFFALASGVACKQDAPLPYVGQCAKYPDGVYEYGEIGIGTCIAGPTEVQFTDDENGQPILLVTNANTYQNFTGGSLLAIPWSGIQLDQHRNVVHETGAGAVSLPDFAGGLALQGDLGLVTVRLSEGARRRQHWDDVWLVDLTDPLQPTLSNRGTDGSHLVRVQSDPNDVELDPISGYAFVANRTTHSISVLDTSSDLVSVVRPWPESVMTAAVWNDADNSGSRGELTDVEVIETSLMTDDNWSLDWISGTWRTWVEADGGLLRYQDVGDHSWRENGYGLEMSAIAAYSEDGRIIDPSFSFAGRMYYASTGSIRGAHTYNGVASIWIADGYPLLSPSDEGWDSVSVGGPGSLFDIDGSTTLFYDAVGDDLSGLSSIGAAWSPNAIAFERDDAPLLSPTLDFEAGGIFDPGPVLDPETGETVIFYSAFDGTTYTIGRATSWDRITWNKDEFPVLSVPGVDVAAPEVSASVGLWRMSYSRRGDDGLWSVWEAESPDGYTWTEVGKVVDLDDSIAILDEPPGSTLAGVPENRFRIYGESAENLNIPVISGIPALVGQYGWAARPVTGFLYGPGDAGAESEGGIQVSSIDTDAGLAWLSLRSAGGIPRVGLATVGADLSLTMVEGAVFEGSEGHDRDGADLPVVVQLDGVFHMYYRATRGRVTRIGHATSPDGRTWTREGTVLSPGNDWDSSRIEPGSVEVLDDGQLRLWYAGTDGELWRIGSAISSDGVNFVRETGDGRGEMYPPGRPGDWDDSGVRHPYALRGADSAGREGTHLWYSGYDGSTWRGGYAFRPDATDLFERAEDVFTGIARPVLLAGGGQFSTDGAIRPVVVPTDDGWRGFYSGRIGNVDRIGGVSGDDPAGLHRVLNMPTVGDSLTFSTERGDPDALAIPLDAVLPPGIAVTGTGLTALKVDTARGFLYAVGKLTAYLYVIDIRDDSNGSFQDLNYLDIEAVLPVPSASLDAGFREVIADPTGDRLYALQDDPEAVVVIDISEVEDDGFPNVLNDRARGVLPLPRGAVRDQGVDTLTDVGPSAMVLHPDGRRLFVANFNANSVTVFDLDLGTWGQQVADVSLVGEGPAGMTLTPDGRHLVVANFLGEVDNNGLVQSNLAIVDVDESSPTHLEVLTWITND